MSKVALFAFNGDPLCFVHVLLNALDMDEKGMIVKVIIEGSAVKLIGPLAQEDHPFHQLYQSCLDAGLIDCVCQACSHKLGSLVEAKRQNLRLCHDMSGHPSMSSYLQQGFDVITF